MVIRIPTTPFPGGGGGTTTVQITTTQLQPIILDGDPGEDGLPGVPGAQGAAGATGGTGAPGVAVFDIVEGEQGDMGPPGPAGVSGSAGAAGATGSILYIDPEVPEEPWHVPGPAGTAGSAGSTGAQGPQGPSQVPETYTEWQDDIVQTPPPVAYVGLLQGAISVADQTIAAATATTITGSKIQVPLTYMLAGQKYRWTMYGTKSSPTGIGASTIAIKLGTAGTTADANITTFSTPAGTAVADTFLIEAAMTVRSTGTAGVGMSHCLITHNLNTTGFINLPAVTIQGTTTTFNTTAANQYLSVAFTGGATVTVAISQCYAEAFTPP